MRDKGDHYKYIAVHVDDLIITGEEKMIDRVIKTLASKFKLGSITPLSWYLNLKIQHDKTQGALTITGEQYSHTVEERFNLQTRMAPRLPYRTSDAQNWKKAPDTKGEQTNQRLYMQKVGSMAWPAVHWRPDLSFVTFRAARYSQDPRAFHECGVDLLLNYLAKTPTHGLLYKKAIQNQEDEHTIVTYVDADFMGEPDKKRSTYGYLIYMDGNLVHWTSKLIKPVVPSSTAAELIGLYHAYQNTIWIRDLCETLKIKVATPTIYCDNQAAIHAVTGERPTKALQHNRTTRPKLFELRDKLKDANATVHIKHVKGTENPADILTKAAQTGTMWKGLTEQHMCSAITTTP